MKQPDITDEHVLALAQAYRDAPHGTAPGVIEALTNEGIPLEVAVAKVEDMCDRNLMDYGVSVNYAWPAPYLADEDGDTA